jgi:hypothetical protein
MLWIHTVLIQGSRDQLAFDQSPELIAVFHALPRLLAPRHPPHALSSLAALIHPLAVIRRLRVRLTDQDKIKLRYRPVRAFGQVCVTKSILRFSRRIQRISYFHKKPSSLVKIQLFPLPNCQRAKPFQRNGGQSFYARSTKRQWTVEKYLQFAQDL